MSLISTWTKLTAYFHHKGTTCFYGFSLCALCLCGSYKNVSIILSCYLEGHSNNTSALHSGPIRLELVKFVDVEPGGELVPLYHFKILDKQERVVGHINLKVGNTRHITLYVGHIGFAVQEEFRGHHYAYHACQALRPLILRFFKKLS